MFSNILNNATKYTPEHGHITLSLTVRASEVEVAIEDDGIGVDPTLLPHLFELFTQAERSPDRAQGGLGLVRSLVELHEGSVVGESAGAGKGSKFIVRLPRAVNLEPKKMTPPQSEARPASSLRILVVDDNIDAAHTLAMLLELQGHQAQVEYDGSAALMHIKRYVPQVMILDIGLPDMDGYELAKRVRASAEAAGTALIALTGYGQSDDRARSSMAGFDYHLVKPVSAQELLTVLAEVEQTQKQ